MSVRDDPEYRALCAYAARIGADPSLVQAAGGNVSLKRDGVLWIKASGTWLAEAESRDIMVPVALAPMLDALDRGEAEDTTPFVRRDLDRAGLRPSIETSLHGMLPHDVVVHVHCVETIVCAVRADAPSVLAGRLAGLAWHFVPYLRPGPPLAQAMRAGMPGRDGRGRARQPRPRRRRADHRRRRPPRRRGAAPVGDPGPPRAAGGESGS